MVKNTALLRLRVWLNRLGFVKPLPVNYDAFAARMCLETSMACYYKSKVGNIAGFFFPGEFCICSMLGDHLMHAISFYDSIIYTDLPYVDGDGEKKVCRLMTVYVDVTTKKMTKAMFDTEEISSRNVAGILFFYNLSANHVKVRLVHV